MDKERHIIRAILETLNGKGDSFQAWFGRDAEPFTIAGNDLLFTTDEFSSEDLFRDHDPEMLGWNLAAASISDIYAGGGIPLFYGHSMAISPEWKETYVQELSRGIASCLQFTGAKFIGGDLGFADRWHYTGIVIGDAKQPLNRKGAQPGDLIFITGSIGKGNFEAALSLYSDYTLLKPFLNRYAIRFPVRKDEAELIRKTAHCCIDTSDGVFRALKDLAEINGVGFIIDDLPYDKDALIACRLLGKPKELLFLGECGEYELLFTIPPERETGFVEDVSKSNLVFTKIGRITGSRDEMLLGKEKSADLRKLIFYARDYPDPKTYLEDLTNAIKDETRG